MAGVNAEQTGSAVPRTIPNMDVGGAGLDRPSQGERKESVAETISNFHVPGEYPKSGDNVPKTTTST